MKIAEKATLRDYIESLDIACNEFSNANDFYNNINSVPEFSLQRATFEKDMEFLAEVSKILSIISSIISHPHISNKREEIVIRIEQARHLQQDAFRQVLQDSSLWKSRKGKMIPEQVYYYQHVDELRIYENQFIVLLVDLLDVEISKCNSFYLGKLPFAVAGDNIDFSPITTSIPQGDCALAIKRAEKLKRRIRFIKNTNFYKVVSQGKGISPVIKPTNILLKDRLYRACFKFYRQFVRYDDELALKEDIAKFASVITLKTLGDLGFTLTSAVDCENGGISDNRAIAPFFNGSTFNLSKNGFNATCGYNKDLNALFLTVDYDNIEGSKVSHLLAFDIEEENNFTFDCNDNFLTVDIFSVWNSFAWENNKKRLLAGDFNEKEMIKQWILSKITVILGDKEVYSKYCPVCKARSVDASDNGAVCSHCGSEYLFIDEQNSRVWLKKIRRV